MAILIFYCNGCERHPTPLLFRAAPSSRHSGRDPESSHWACRGIFRNDRIKIDRIRRNCDNMKNGSIINLYYWIARRDGSRG